MINSNHKNTSIKKLPFVAEIDLPTYPHSLHRYFIKSPLLRFLYIAFAVLSRAAPLLCSARPCLFCAQLCCAPLCLCYAAQGRAFAVLSVAWRRLAFASRSLAWPLLKSLRKKKTPCLSYAKPPCHGTLHIQAILARIFRAPY